MRYYIKYKLNPREKRQLGEAVKSGSLAKDKIFYEGMQTALREDTIDENDTVHFIEICYCLEGGLYPMAMEIPTLKEYFDNIVEVKDARLRDQCTTECEFCDCTRSIKLPGKSLSDKLNVSKEESDNSNSEFIDIGRLKLNRRKQQEGIESLRNLLDNGDANVKPIFAEAAISGLFAIFHDGSDYFRIKNISDSEEARKLLKGIGLEVYGTVPSIKQTARNSLAKSDKCSNVV
jgi:predicted nucleic acid-binding protein